MPILISATEARTRLESHYREKNTADEIAIAEETLKALGLLPADASLDDLYLDMLGSQVLAFYETDTDQLFVISRSGGIGANEKVYFSHEFTHALQDQHFDVEAIDDPAAGEGDRSLARLALVGLRGDEAVLQRVGVGLVGVVDLGGRGELRGGHGDEGDDGDGANHGGAMALAFRHRARRSALQGSLGVDWRPRFDVAPARIRRVAAVPRTLGRRGPRHDLVVRADAGRGRGALPAARVHPGAARVPVRLAAHAGAGFRVILKAGLPVYLVEEAER